MTLDIVSKGIPYLHMVVVTVMVFAGAPRIFTFTSLMWIGCAIMSIPLTEEEIHLELPTLWRYRHLFAVGTCILLLQSV